MRNVASISSMSHSVTREWIDRRSMIRSTANSIHELSTRGGLTQPLVTEGAGLVVGIADIDPSGLSPLVIQRALVGVPQVGYTRSHDVQREKERLLLTPTRTSSAVEPKRRQRPGRHGANDPRYSTISRL
jgi:hypothetical protein